MAIGDMWPRVARYRQTGQTDNGLIAYGEQSHKRSPKNQTTDTKLLLLIFAFDQLAFGIFRYLSVAFGSFRKLSVAFGIYHYRLTVHCQWEWLHFFVFLSLVTLTFDLDICTRATFQYNTVHLTTKFHHPMFNRSEVIVLTNRCRWKHTPCFAMLRRWVNSQALAV